MTSNERLAAALADRYVLERELGAGGMATVYLAEDVRHRRKVAVKVLRPELAASMKGIMIERGGQLYFTLGENESDLWVVELGSTR